MRWLMRGVAWRHLALCAITLDFALAPISISVTPASWCSSRSLDIASRHSTSPVVWINNLTMTQWLGLVFHPTHPFDNPTLFVAGYWSLNYEEQFYLVMGLIMFGATYFKKSMLAPIVALMLRFLRLESHSPLHLSRILLGVLGPLRFRRARV